MPLPPTIPTSFVPHPGADSSKRYRSDISGAFAFLGYGVLGLVVILAVGVFVYDRVLVAEQNAKDAALAKQEAAIDPHTINEFVRLQNRLTYSAQLLNAHVAFSGFFRAIETLLPSTVRFTSLHLSIDDSGAPQLVGTGEARTFNALAAASDAFAADGRIKDAIFSKITVEQGGAVSFGIQATLDPTLVAYTPDAYTTVAAPAPPDTQAASTSPQ